MKQHGQTITLRDGRTLGFAEWGDLEGKAVFYFTSPEASRYSRHPDESILTDLGIRLLTFDRPGRGLSTPHKGRNLLDWADDMAEFIQDRSIERFALIGHSQGTAHCLVCAHKMPDRVSSVTAVSSVAGVHDPELRKVLKGTFNTQVFLARYLPWLLTFQWNMFRTTINSERGRNMILDGMRKSLPEDDLITLILPGAEEVNFQSLGEGLRQGGAGVTRDFRLTAGDWGFALDDIQTKVFIWHGEADPMMPVEMSHYLANHLPNNETTFVPEGGSLLLYGRWREILNQIVEHWQK